MRRTMLLGASALLIGLLVNSQAEAWRGGYRGGGFRGTAVGFGGTGWAAHGLAGPRFAGGWGGARWGTWGGVCPGWGGDWGVRPRWGWAGQRPWGWRAAGWPLFGAGLGFAAASFYPYDYGYSSYAYGGCPLVRRRIFDGWGWRIVWVNPCSYW